MPFSMAAAMIIATALLAGGCASTNTYSLRGENRIPEESSNTLRDGYPRSSAEPSDSTRGWLEVERLKLTFRHGVLDELNPDRNGLKRYRLLFDGRVKLDEEEKYSVKFGFSTGRGRNGNWNEVSGEHYIFLKGLSLEAELADGLELEVGSLSHTRNTVVKSFDADTYVAGGRLTLQMPDRLYFDDISLTLGNAGESERPGAIERLHRMGDINFKQLVAGKNLGERFSLSAEYSEIDGHATLRQSATIQMTEGGLLDIVSIKLYEPLDIWPETGYSVYGEKNLTNRLALGAGYASIVAPSFERHGRAFVLGRYQISDTSSLVAFFTESVGTSGNDGQLDVFLSFDLLEMLKKRR